METAVCVSGFVLLIFITGVHLSPDPEPVFRLGGGVAEFKPSFSRVDDYMLYRVSGDGDLLLVNCSQPERPQPHGYEVECLNSSDFYYMMYNLNMSQSGHYRAEGWRGGNITEHRNFRLTVCAEGGAEEYEEVAYDSSVELCSLNSTLDHGSSIQLYRQRFQILDDFGFTRSGWTLVLDTNSSLEPLVEDLRGRLQVDLNTSLVTLSVVRELYSVFYCAVWRGAQCQSYSNRHLHTIPKYVFAYEEENVTLPCILKGELPRKVHWVFQNGSVRSSINQTQPQEVMYMLNGSQTGNYSLIIPSVSLQHSGLYTCVEHDADIELGSLFVCMKFSLLDVEFSHSESVLLYITKHLNESCQWYGIQWYRQKVFQSQVLILDFHSDYLIKPVPLPEDLRGRVTVSNLLSNSTLTISNLTAEDSGLYTWRVHGCKGTLGNYTYGCSEGTFWLVYRDPFGVHSPFYRAYAPLIGCVLLGLVTAVIWFRLRSRRGEQTSGRQSREGQQSGDEDLYDEVEMAELNT